MHGFVHMRVHLKCRPGTGTGVFCTTDFIYTLQGHIQLQLINVAFNSLKASTETLKSNLSDRWHFQSFISFLKKKRLESA